MTLLYLLPFLSTLTGIYFSVASLHVRLDQFAIVLLGLLVISSLIMGKRRLYIDGPGKFLILFFLWSFAISLVAAPRAYYSITETVNLLSAAGVYFLLTNLLGSIQLLERYFRFFLMAAILITGYGILIFVLSLTGIPVPGVSLTDTYHVAYGVYATMREPNVFGSFSLIVFILCFVIVLALPSKIRRYDHLIYPALITSGLGVILSFTRGVWLAAGLGVVAGFVVPGRVFKLPRKKIVRIINLSFFVFLVCFLVYLFASRSIFFYKITHFFDFKGGTGAGRLEIWKTAIQSIQDSPLVGHGTYSFAILFPSNIPGPENASWIGNFFLTILHDTGVVGAVLFLAMIFVLFKDGLRAVKRLRTINPMAAAICLGLCFSLICMLIAFLFTTAFSYVYAWSVLGFIGAFVRYAKHVERESEPRRE